MVAEGTYPYIRGGVSAWIHQLITSLPEFTFEVLFLGSRREDYGEVQYKIPDNVVSVKEFFLFDKSERPPARPIKRKEEVLRKLEALHSWFRKSKGDIPQKLHRKEFYLEEVKEEELLYGRSSWEFICENYFSFAEDTPFIDYFWSVRNIHAPLWRVASIVEKVDRSKVVHSPSTGYAGFLSSLIRNSFGTPFILTEHGIYTRERKIDILNSDWIKDKRFFFQREYGEIDHLRKMWINFFIGIGKISYTSSSVIISLFEDARRVQISLGAPPEKTRVIPNGVRLELYEEARESRKRLPVIALIGRVVPIKDVKTFIKAMRIVVNKVKKVEGWIVGPTDEDPDYYKECKKLVEVLKLEDKVKFLGFQKTPEILKKVKLTTLTSISEGMPLVVLESFAAGVPCVATDVGSCRQLIYGGINEEDVELGKAGRVTPVANPGKIAESYLELLKDEVEWQKCSLTAYKRVKKFYSFELFIENYRKLYREFMNGGNRI